MFRVAVSLFLLTCADLSSMADLEMVFVDVPGHG